MKITGCYRESLTKQMWNGMTPQKRFNHLNSLSLSDEKKREWAEMKWEKLKGRRTMVKGILGGHMLATFANSIGRFKTSAERRIELCPTSGWYEHLLDEERYP